MGELGLYEAMRTTRAVRRLRPDPIPDAVLARVLEAATWAPSGGNRQPWRIVVVRDDATKRALQRMYEEGWHAYLSAARGDAYARRCASCASSWAENGPRSPTSKGRGWRGRRKR
jgi:nitroreductase